MPYQFWVVPHRNPSGSEYLNSRAVPENNALAAFESPNAVNAVSQKATA
jgi:hypothetical protein